MEALGGHDAYTDYVVTQLFPDALNANDSYSIYDPDYYWGATVYQKSGCVMHMLRSLLGDSAFFDALREYGQEHAFATAVTPHWQAKLEEHYGGSLDWFFQPWVYGTRYPQYDVHYGPHPSYPLMISQVQPTPTLFRMPADVRAYSGGDSATVSVWLPAARDTSIQWIQLFPQFSTLDSVLLDPDHNILKTVLYHNDLIPVADPANVIPAAFRITALYPDPFNSATTIAFDLPLASRVQLLAFNLLGREVEHADLGLLTAGTHSFVFDGGRLTSGIYLMKLESNLGVRSIKAVLLK